MSSSLEHPEDSQPLTLSMPIIRPDGASDYPTSSSDVNERGELHGLGIGESQPTDQAATDEAIERLQKILLGSERTLRRREIAAGAGVSLLSARKLWRALGFPDVGDNDQAYTEQDQKALDSLVSLVRDRNLTEDAAISITRSIGQMTDRMVVWQVEALIEEMIANQGLTDEEARRRLVHEMPSLIEPLERSIIYAWRRNLNAAVDRLAIRSDSGPATPGHGTGAGAERALPLARAVGFCDLVSYTALSRTMSDRTLAQLVQRFDRTCSEIISVGGGRLVKTIGDEVLYIAPTPQDGAEISLALAQAINDDDKLPPARVSLVWGRILSRLGDIYGPTVNLAARLTALAEPGTVLTDAPTAATLSDDERYILLPQSVRSVRGFGDVHPVTIARGRGGGLSLD
jgi:adenylate cyclase